MINIATFHQTSPLPVASLQLPPVWEEVVHSELAAEWHRAQVQLHLETKLLKRICSNPSIISFTNLSGFSSTLMMFSRLVSRVSTVRVLSGSGRPETREATRTAEQRARSMAAWQQSEIQSEIQPAPALCGRVNNQRKLSQAQHW